MVAGYHHFRKPPYYILMTFLQFLGLFRRRRPSMTCTPVPPSWLFIPRRVSPIFGRASNTMVILTDYPPICQSIERNITNQLINHLLPVILTLLGCLGLVIFHDPFFFESATSTSLYSSETPWFNGQYYLSKTSLVPFTEAVSFAICH